jgi:hypothetical protein
MGEFKPSLATNISEGFASTTVGHVKLNTKDPLPTFIRVVALEVISDPDTISPEKILYWENILGVSNSKYANILPRNTIIGQRILDGISTVDRTMFMFPFFPSHLALPCKPGEMFWAMIENPNAGHIDMAYWICRITEPHFVDDVNHTHHARQLDSSFVPSIRKSIEKTDQPIYELRNGKTDKDTTGARRVVPDSEIIPSENEDIFEKIITLSDAAQMMQYESVPRFRKRPGDIVLEGSNNSLIVLGTDRTGPVANYVNSDLGHGLIPINSNEDVALTSGFAGSIDMVVGRGTTNITGGNEASTVSMNLENHVIKKELGKSSKELVSGEGDPDFFDDRSRILLSQRTMVNESFELDDSNIPKDNLDGDAAIAIKSDKIRIIARSDISLIVKGYEETNESSTNKNSYKTENSDNSMWASITIYANGDIVFSPSDKGVIKLGGPDANKAVLCTSQPAKNNEGKVKSLPIATTAGGFVGTAQGNVDNEAIAKKKIPDMGTFSTKVLIK